MPAIAPWENPDLPAPFATIEREIEGRTRRFALWRWDERIVWRDLERPSFWWATQDVAGMPEDWDRAIDTARFGGAFTSQCDKAINGRILELWPHCTLRLWRTFYVIVAKNGSGMAREKEGDLWIPFTPREDARTKRKHEEAPSLWHPNRRFFGINREIMRAFAPVLLERVAPGLRDFALLGDKAAALQKMKDLVAWNVERKVLFESFARKHRTLYRKIVSGFGLPVDFIYSVSGEKAPEKGVQFHLWLSGNYQNWQIQIPVSLATTAHELLELQLRLRDALRPILTATEIAEILAV